MASQWLLILTIFSHNPEHAYDPSIVAYAPTKEVCEGLKKGTFIVGDKVIQDQNDSKARGEYWMDIQFSCIKAK